MKVNRLGIFQIAVVSCFCLILGALSGPAYASSVSSTRYEFVQEGICSYCGGVGVYSKISVSLCGAYSFNCNDCNAFMTSNGGTAPHSWKEVSRTDSTCVSSGSVSYTCSDCNLVTRIDTLSPLSDTGDHTWVEESVPATCVTAGTVTHTCSVCGESGKSDELPALGHVWQETGTTAPTCTEAGVIHRTCSRCNLFASEVIPALGVAHDWEETSRTDATETTAGSIGYICSTCGATRSERIPPTGIDLSMSGLLRVMTDVFGAGMGWVGTVADVIARSPILLFVVVISFVGTAVVLFRRLLRF